MNKVILLFVFLILTSCSAQNPPVPSQFPEETSNYQKLFDAREVDGVKCFRIPALVTAPNGDLIAAIDERALGCADLRGSKDINIVIRRSQDNGKTWGDIETVVDFPFGVSASDPSMIVDQETGEVFLFYNYMDLENEKDIYYLQFVKSSDNGKTWSKPKDITSQITKDQWYNDFKFITSGHGIQAQSGRLLHTLVDLDKGVYLFGSDDHGASWFFIDSPVNPADESKVIELDNGDYMINSRVNGGMGYRYVHISHDKGKTWETRPEKELTDPGNNASIVVYPYHKNGKTENLLLFTNSNNRDSRKNLTIKVSYDQGKTWSAGKVIYPGSAAYSSMTVLENGDIGVFFEKDDYTENVFVSFPIEFVTQN
ncbi:exo-alpha-sialidase [Christiangramia fulva]|uniref:exo-alpha-sialidase n=1 Tax=Christiangramia fulva TaxID=2126553 RepID=A0A2R3ZAE2_9FLAO|nr:sialidase family protein [Christiangramia fulva]AVR47132.1 exo-alpha-sialidase [Christiangramia fulva]